VRLSVSFRTEHPQSSKGTLGKARWFLPAFMRRPRHLGDRAWTSIHRWASIPRTHERWSLRP